MFDVVCEEIGAQGMINQVHFWPQINSSDPESNVTSDSASDGDRVQTKDATEHTIGTQGTDMKGFIIGKDGRKGTKAQYNTTGTNIKAGTNDKTITNK